MHNDRQHRQPRAHRIHGHGQDLRWPVVAELLHFDFLDTDELIQTRTGRTIADIFAKDGEPAFRALERQTVGELAARTRTVISTGGGLPANPENLASLKTHALVVCLWASPEKIWERVRNQSHRPLLHDPDPQTENPRTARNPRAVLPAGRRADQHRFALRPRSGAADRLAVQTRHPPGAMKAAIRQRAAELGFDDCRFTTAAAPASAEQFQHWLAQKQHGEMTWLERNAEKRADPQKILPGAKSIIALAASYETGKAGKRQSAEIAQIRRHRPLRPVCRLPRRAGRTLEKLDAVRQPARRRGHALALVCGHRAGAGTRFGPARRPRLCRQAHQRHQPQAGQLDFSRGNFDDAGTCAGCAGEKPLRQLHALHRRLSDQRHHRAVSTGRAQVHFLSDD